MKKLVFSILCTLIASAVGVSTMLNDPISEKPKEQLKQETKIEQVDEKVDTEEAVKNEEKEEIIKNPTKTEKSEKAETKSKSTNKPSSSVSNVPKQNTTMKQESNSNSNSASNSQPTQNTTPSSNTQNNSPTQKNNISTTFYDSITGGKKEFSSESEAFARGTQIQNNELDYVLDWNETHPDNQIQPDINYFRVYPSVIDENGKYWYYLHFFCRTGEGNDTKLKSMF